MWTVSRIPAVMLLAALCLGAWTEAMADQASDDYALAVALYKQQRYDLAEEALGKFIVTFPDDAKVPTARLYRSQAMINLANYEAAREVLREYIKIAAPAAGATPDKNLQQARYRVAECSYLLADYKTAQSEFETWLASASDDPLLEWGLPYYGDTLLRNGQSAQALEIFQKSLEKFPQGKLADDSRFGLAKAFESTSQIDKAVEIYQKIASEENQPRASQALIKLALMAYDRKDYDSTVEILDRFLDRFPSDALVSYVWLNRGQASYAQANYAEAVRSYAQAKANPEYVLNATFWQGMSEQMLGNHAAALKLFSEVKLSNEQRASSLGSELVYQVGLSLAMSGETDEALDAWQELIESAPKHARTDDAMIRSLDLLVNAGRWEKAQQLVDLFARDYTQSEWRDAAQILHAKLIIGQATELEADDPEAARTQFLQAVTLLEKTDFTRAEESTRLLARYQMARAFHKASEYQSALDLLEPMMAVDENKKSFPEALAVLSISYLAIKDNASAATAAEGYLSSSNKTRKDPATEAQVLATLAIAHIRLGNEPTAKTAYANLLKQNVSQEVIAKLSLQIAEEAYQLKQYALADSLYDQIVSKGSGVPSYLPALWGSAWSAYERQNFEVASQRFLKLAKTTEQAPAMIAEAHHMAGIALQKAGQLPLAAKTFTDGYAAYEDQDLTLLLPALRLQIYRCAKEAARAYRLQSQLESAEKAYQLAVSALKSLSPEEQVNLDKLYDEWALLHYEAGQYGQADKIYALLLKDCPTSNRADDALLVLAESDFINGQLDRSQQRFEDLMTREGADDLVRKRAAYQLVMLAAEEKAWTDVITRSETYLSALTPGSSSPLTSEQFQDKETLEVAYQKAKALVETDQLAAAQTWLASLRTTLSADTKTFQREPLQETAASIWLLSAECARRQKQYIEVLSLVDEIETSFNGSPFRADAHVIAGRTYIAQAKFSNAHESFQRAQQILDAVKNETAVQSHFYQAETYLMQKNYKDALSSYMRVYLLYQGYDQWRSAALFQTAQCDEVMGNVNNALDAYRKLVSEFPDSLEAPKAQDRLARLGTAP